MKDHAPSPLLKRDDLRPSPCSKNLDFEYVILSWPQKKFRWPKHLLSIFSLFNSIDNGLGMGLACLGSSSRISDNQQGSRFLSTSATDEFGGFVMKGKRFLLKRSILFISALSFILFSSHSFGATINVPGDQPTIQAGIDAATKDLTPGVLQ
jgi:hypothetical protein